MAEKSEKKKNNRPAGIAPRNKQSYAQYVWIRNIFCRMDSMEKEIAELKKTVKYLSDCLITLDEEMKKAAKRND